MRNRFGLGRLEAPDARDIPLILPRSSVGTLPSYRYWNANGWWGNQGGAPQCVGYAWAHWVEDGPVTHSAAAPVVDPANLYFAAQEVDEWEGVNYAGTSVRAGAKVLQSRGVIAAYRWATAVDEIAATVLAHGPVVVGTHWLDAMFEPNDKGFIEARGGLAGGHAYLLNGVNMKRGFFRIKNSWGRSWGKRGHAFITFADFARLMERDGEACVAFENPTKGR